MSISPIRSPDLPGPSSANFSFFPDEDKNQATLSNQELTLKDRIKLVLDSLGYKAYSVLHPPRIKPLSLAHVSYQEVKKAFFAKKPLSYEEAREKTLGYTKYHRGTWACDLGLKFK